MQGIQVGQVSSLFDLISDPLSLLFAYIAYTLDWMAAV